MGPLEGIRVVELAVWVAGPAAGCLLSDWGADELSERQLAYAASDVLHLHELRTRLDVMLAREGRSELAEACFKFVPMRARLDLGGWDDTDIFAH